MIGKLIKTFDENYNFENVIVPLSLDFTEVCFVYHHEIKPAKFNSCSKILHKYKDIKVSYHRVDENSIEELMSEGAFIDITAAKYLSIVLFENAFKYHLPIIYYDDQECCIKSYRRHETVCSAIKKLSIEDLVILGGGTIKKQLHKEINDPKTNDIIIEAVDKSLKKYSSFISFIQKVNNYCGDQKGNRVHLNKETINRIANDEQYSLHSELLRIDNDELIFANSDIRRCFEVSGIFLESYVYHKLKDSSLFDDVQMSLSIDFSSVESNYPSICEIDVVAVKDNKLLFISCKSNKVDTPALNEIVVHNLVFGTYDSRPVICTINDLNEVAPSVYLKAEELNVAIIDYSTFRKNDIAKAFLDILEDKYQYEKIN